MKRFTNLIIIILIPFTSSAQLYLNKDRLTKMKRQLIEEPYKTAYIELINKANLLLDVPNLSVVDDKEHIPASGDIHDYMSIARYTWPDTTKVDGLPYIGRDGYTNPEYNTYDREPLLKMVDRVRTFTIAWYFSNEKSYAKAAIEQLRVWFLRKDTYMNPNMYYGQVIKGNNNLTPTGVLDGAGFVDLLDAFFLLDDYYSWGWHKDLKRLSKWFESFLDWIETSEQGLKESKSKDNTGTSYDLQRLAYNLFCGRTEKSQDILNNFIKDRVMKQIDERGVQIEEVKRTSSFGYSVSNISVMMDFITMAHNHGLDLSQEAQSRFYKAIDYLIPYLDESREWPYQEIQDMSYYRNRLCFELYRIATCIDSSRQDYLQLYERYGKMNEADVNILLY